MFAGGLFRRKKKMEAISSPGTDAEMDMGGADIDVVSVDFFSFIVV
jgi:hypothetical protein